MNNQALTLNVIFYIIIGCILQIQAQTFSLKFPQNALNQYSSISTNENNIALVGFDFDNENNISRNVFVSKISYTGDLLWSKQYPSLILRNHILSLPNVLIEPLNLLESNEIVISTSVTNASVQGYQLVLLSSEGTPKWSKYIEHSTETFQPPTILEAEDGSIYSFLSIQNSKTSAIVSFQHFDLDGNLLFEKQLLDPNGSDMDIYKYHKIDEQKIAISKYDYTEKKSIVSLYDNRLNFIEAFSINLNVKNLLFKESQYFIAGEELNFGLFSVSPKICSLNEDFSLNWAKAINSTIFSEFYELSLSDDKLIYKAFESGLNFIVQIDSDGLINKGIRIPINNSTNSNDFETGNNNNFIYFSRDQSNNDIFLNLVDSTFQPKCTSASFCPNFLDILLETNLSQEIFSAHDLEIFIQDFDIEAESRNFTLENECISSVNFNNANPFFKAPDTVCVNEIIELEEIQNLGASFVNWEIPGSSLPNTFSFIPQEFWYPEEGTYTITQTVDINNCESIFSVDIVVQASIEISGLKDTISICQDESVLIDPGLQNVDYLWLPDSSTNTSIVLNLPGNYSLELSSDHCKSNVNFVLTQISTELLMVDLGADTSICEQKPLLLNPSLIAGLEFIWDDGQLEASRLITQTGLYTLNTSIGDCNINNTIFVQVEDCSTQVYLPNAFSPNQDGINDDFFPLGNFFEVVSFKIFDRWGNLVHDAPSPWHGFFKEKEAAIGVYTYSLNIRNTLLDEEEFMKGDVILSR